FSNWRAFREPQRHRGAQRSTEEGSAAGSRQCAWRLTFDCLPFSVRSLCSSVPLWFSAELLMSLRRSNQVFYHAHQRIVLKAALREIRARAGVESHESIFFAILVRHDDDRQLGELRLAAQGTDEFDASHARHVDVGDEQVIAPGSQRVVAFLAVD